jgi:hypothetical protein
MKIVILPAAMLAAACSRTDPPAPAAAPADRVAAWRDDLRTIATELPARHVDPFLHVSEPDFRRAVADLDARLGTLDDAHAMVALMRLVASVGDGHTQLSRAIRIAHPIRFYAFPDGIRVTGAPDDAAWAIGRTLVGIGGRSIDDTLAAARALIPHESDAWVRNNLPEILHDAQLLAGLDLAPDAAHATFRLAADDGTTRDLTLSPGPLPALHLTGAPPLWMQKTHLTYWNTYDAASRVLYFAYNQCADGKPPFADFAASTLAFADQHPVDRFVIDLRHNGGGNSEIIRPLLDGLAARPALAARVVGVIGRETFSSGTLDAIYLHRLGAPLYGEPTGGSPNGTGEVKTLPLHHATLTYSTKHFTSDLYPGDSVTPDVPIAITYADWLAGRDPVLDAIAALPPPR